MRYPINVNGIIIIDNKFLLLKRCEEDGGFWQYVSGGLDENESPEQAVIREVKEETNLDVIGKPKYLTYQIRERKGLPHMELIFVAETEGEIVISKEHTEFKLVDYNEAKNLVIHEGIKLGIEKAYEIYFNN